MCKPEIVLIDDKEYPVCNRRIRKSLSDLNIINARVDSEVMNEITRRGLHIDHGVLTMGSELYYAANAIHRLGLISSRSGIFNQVNYWIFKSRALSRLFYPILRYPRHLLLKVLGKTRINNPARVGNNKF